MLYLAGQRFGRLTAIRCTDETNKKGYIWECLCDCGKTVFLPTAKFKGAKGVRSCGCLLKDFYKSTRVDITGKTFYRLTAIKCTDERDKLKNILWLFKCACGKEVVCSASSVKDDSVKSCGCQKIDKAMEASEDMRKRILWTEGTCINSIASTKIPKNNTSGITGVYWYKKSNKWRAQIRFKGVNYYLGSFFTLSEAEAARKDAEEKYFKPMIEKYADKLLEIKQGKNL